MCKPKMINIELKAIFGIITWKPFKAINDVANIGPIIQARGILKKSAIMALGIEIMITIKNFLEISWFKLSRFKGIALCMHSIFGCWLDHIKYV